MTRHYTADVDREGNRVPDHPMRCHDCNRPAYYDTADEDYHHAEAPHVGCFLIRAEDRKDDPAHPLMRLIPDPMKATTPYRAHTSDVVVRRHLDLSTTHIPSPGYLDDTQLCAYSTPYGWLVYADTLKDREVMESCPELAPALAFAMEHGCTWITFDCDGDVQPSLPTWEW